MIANHQEYLRTKESLADWQRRVVVKRTELKQQGFDDEAIEQALAPEISFYKGYEEEIAHYEKHRERNGNS